VAVTVKGGSGLEGDRQQQWDDVPLAVQHWLRRGLSPTVAPPQSIMTPQSREELAEIMAIAHREQWRVMPMGAGTKLGWGRGRSQIDLVVQCDRLNQVVEQDPGDLTISVEAGMTLGALQQELAKHGQFLPVDPSYPDQATLGGIVATADAGSLRQGYGGVRDMLLGIEFVRHDGQRSRAGGKVVKNVAGYDLMKLFTGAYGTLGLISRLTWRVYPIPESWQTIALTGPLDALVELNGQVLGSSLTPIAWEWTLMPPTADIPTPLSTVATGHPCLVGRFASVSASTQAQVAAVTQQAIALGLTVQALTDEQDSQFWQQYSQAIAPPRSPDINTNGDHNGSSSDCHIKLGILSTAAPPLIQALKQQRPNAILQLRAGSGVGRLRLLGSSAGKGGAGKEIAQGTDNSDNGNNTDLAFLEKLRQTCQQHHGFLSLLDAPSPLKSQFDPWGHSSPANPMAIALRQTFDPQRLINPNCFVV
ncbi:MAG: FAD-binding oxidoreductase, partial [Cyanobacteria bacterium P01_H01_bin.130]